MDKKIFDVAFAKAGIRSVAQLARIAGVSAVYGRACSRGLVPSATTRARIAAALGVSVDELYPTACEASAFTTTQDESGGLR